MKKNYCIITIVDSISATSMPVNEFVLFRHINGYGFREIIVSCSDSIPNNIKIPVGVEIHLVGRSCSKMRHILQQLKQECKNHDELIVVHLHAQKSAMQFFMASIGLGLRCRSLFTIHSTYSSRDIQYKLSSCVCALLAEYANCVSNAAYAEYSAIVKFLKNHRMLAIQNGVDFQRVQKAIEDLPSHDRVADMYNMVCIGRMIPIKNQQFLIYLLKELTNTKLILIGQIDDDIKQMAKNEGVEERVEMTGLLSRDEVFRRLNECGIYVSASLVEGMPVSVLEAMSVGLIPVLSDIGPHREVAQSCKTFNTLPLMVEDWVRTIQTYQQMTDRMRMELSLLTKKTVRENFSLEIMQQKYIKIYEQLVE